MKIMVDLDRVVFDCPSFVFEVGNKIFTRTHENNELLYTEIDSEKAMNYTNSLFFLKMSKSCNFVPVNNSVEILKKWHSQGFEIHFVSSRPKFKAFQRATVEWLKNHDINYSRLVFSCSNKAKYCSKHGMNLIVDDTFDNCNNATNLGIPAVWVKTKYNEKEQRVLNRRIYNADSWSKIDMCAQSVHQFNLMTGGNMYKKLYLIADIEREMKRLYGEGSSITAELPMIMSKFNDDIVETGEPGKMKLTFTLTGKKRLFKHKQKKIELLKNFSMIERLHDGTTVMKNLMRTSSSHALLDSVFIMPEKVKDLFIEHSDMVSAIENNPELKVIIDAVNASTLNIG